MKKVNRVRVWGRVLAGLPEQACRFEPTCSQYAQEAVGRYGIFRGGWLAIKRVLRCQPLSTGGFDPVP